MTSQNNTNDQKLLLTDKDNKLVRIFATGNTTKATLIRRHDSRRMELADELTNLESQGINFDIIKTINFVALRKNPEFIPGFGKLQFQADVPVTQMNIPPTAENTSEWKRIMGTTAVIALIFTTLVSFIPRDQKNSKTTEEELREHVVKVIKKYPVRSQLTRAQIQRPTSNTKQRAAVSRMGALSVLGSLTNAMASRGGIKINAIETSAGPGRGGGKAGSGGVQTALYGKGLVAAPVGPGANINGAGGYGTKGKGGGQAGYGELSLVGSSGSSFVPLGSEATVEGGLDRDMIAAVIQKNMGQVRFCYEQGLQMNPQLTGRLAVDFTINGSGSVETSKVGNSTLNAQAVEQCILMRLKTWKFPSPAGGVVVKVSYPFLLKRVGG